MSRKISIGKVAGLGVALLLVTVGAYVVLASVDAKHKSITTTTESAGTQRSTSSVNTKKPSPSVVAAYSVAPNLPKYLMITSIGVDARVFAVGLTTNGVIGTPDNVFDTAWYDGSAKPGQLGAMLIDGHISSWTSPGVFYRLTRLKAGDTVQVVRGDNKVFSYKVVKTVIYPSDKVNMSTVLSPVTPGENGLNLISCTGDIIPHTSKFNERIVVFTQQL